MTDDELEKWAQELQDRRDRHERLKGHGLTDEQAIDAGIRADRIARKR